MTKSKSQFQNLARRLGLFLLDCGLIVLSYYFAILLRFDGADAVRRPVVIQAMAPMLPYALLIYGIVFWVGGLYKIIWDYAGIRDIARMVFLSGLATAFILLVDTIVRQRPISGTVLIIVISLSIRRMPYTIRSSTAIIGQISPSVEEASVSLGASQLKTFLRVTIPMMLPGVLSGAIMSWITLISELSSSVILYTSKTMTLTVAIYSEVIRSNFGNAAAYSTILTLTSIVSLLLFFKLSGRRDLSV